MKKILLSTYACEPGRGSEEGNGWNYASMLSQSELEVHCLTKIEGRSTIETVLAKGETPNLTVHYVLVPKWVDKFCHSNIIGMYFHYIYWQWQAYKVARQLSQTTTFDLVHHATYGSIQLGSFMYKLGIPFVFGPVGGGQRAPKALKRYFGSYWSREWLRDWVGNVLQHVNPGYYKAVRKATRLLVSNAETFKLAKKLRPNGPIDRVWDAGMRKSFLPPKPVEHYPGNVLKLLWTGRMLPRKAIELTIQALGSVDPTIPVTLTIVGGQGEMAEHVPHYIERYGVKDRVNWVGHIPHQEVMKHYEQSDVFFFTSLRDSCPHQVLEAMAYSLPVVTLDLHGQAELVGEKAGIRVPVTNETQVVADLARAIEWMYAHPNERMAMGYAGYEITQLQSWDLKVRRFAEEIYPAALGQTAEKSVVEKL